jgi:hypothetical protein
MRLSSRFRSRPHAHKGKRTCKRRARAGRPIGANPAGQAVSVTIMPAAAGSPPIPMVNGTGNSGNSYQATLPLLSPGIYSYTVSGTDQDEQTRQAPVRTFEIEAVGVNRAPTVALTAPTNNSTVQPGSPMTITASANAQEVNGRNQRGQGRVKSENPRE